MVAKIFQIQDFQIQDFLYAFNAPGKCRCSTALGIA
jgi:hypothetical protein